MNNPLYINRELSWLSFNRRVLQEAENPSVPLFERIKFLAIFSSNLDEFFRVRVASLRSLLALKKKSRDELGFDPKELLLEIHKTVRLQQEEFGRIYREEIIPQLNKNGIFIVDEKSLTPNELEFVKEFYHDNVRQHIQPIILLEDTFVPFLKNQAIYLTVKLNPKAGQNKEIFSLIEIPSERISRFISLPSNGSGFRAMFLEDVVRACLDDIFISFEAEEAYSVKLTRDAELYIDDEFSGNLLTKIKKSLKKRNTGVPSRFLYDSEIPGDSLNFLKNSLNLGDEDMVPGGKYHNFNDFFAFPNPVGIELENPPMPPMLHSGLNNYHDKFEALSNSDFLVHYPYQTYDYIIELLQQAAIDPQVTSIKITQYRVAQNSAIVNSLINAAKNGKDVMVFVEIKARFDEELNIQFAEEMEEAGIKVHYSFPGLKVHAKIALITRIEDNTENDYAYFSTGNFNEKTAAVYTDTSLYTKDMRLTAELKQVFNFLEGKKVDYKFKHLLVAQFNMRKKLNKLIDDEIKNSKSGKEASIILKLNSIEDKKMIAKLSEAGCAGVKIKMIVRGICCLAPGLNGLSDNIEIISIVDRFLEHSRYYIFHNNGDKLVYASSADWMKRNLNRRIEVGFPVYNETLKQEILDITEFHLNDNVKARIIDDKFTNRFVKDHSKNEVRSQTAVYEYLKNKNQNDIPVVM